jgi:protein TonB
MLARSRFSLISLLTVMLLASCATAPIDDSEGIHSASDEKITQTPLRKKYINARTSEPIYRSYMQSCLKQIEEKGNASYPEELKEKGITGSVLLSVEIRADGSLEDIKIRRSSGHQALDEAAKRIAMQAAPFSPFPPEILKDVDILNITATWKFGEQSDPKLGDHSEP